eukprot:SAG11_NODE_33046_length_279_cov_0.866667_1_plen_39_part_10
MRDSCQIGTMGLQLFAEGSEVPDTYLHQSISRWHTLEVK